MLDYHRMLIPDLDPGPDLHDWKGFISPWAVRARDAEELRTIDLLRATVVFDVALQRIAVARGALERQIGRRLAKLNDRARLMRLGFSSLGDCVAERLGLGLRSAQEMARIATQLEELPLLRAASDGAELSPSHVRLLAGFVTAQNEAEWIARAQRLTVRGLREAIRKARQAESKPEEPEQERIRFDAPARFKAKWLAAVDLFRKLEGRDDLSESAAAEAFVAEWSSGEDATTSSRDPRHDQEATAELLRYLRASASPAPGRPGSKSANASLRLGAPKPVDREEIQRLCEERTDHWSCLPRLRNVKLPERLASLDKELSDDTDELDRELREMAILRRQLDAQTGRILSTYERLRLDLDMDFVDADHYASERAGIGPVQARTLRCWERFLGPFPHIEAAYFRGELSERHMRALTEVLGRNGASLTEQEWLERARTLTLRRFEDEVRATSLRLGLIEGGVIRAEARDRRRDSVVAAPPPADVDLQAEIQELEALALGASEANVLSARVRAHGPALRVSFVADLDMRTFWDQCVEACRWSHGLQLREWQCAERFIDAFVAVWDRKDPYRHVLEHKVIARDGYRCTVPGCRMRRNLQAHHVRWRSRGGEDSLDNLTTLCSAHHLHGVHELRINVTGIAPHALTWELGLRSDGSALMVVGPGERILDARAGAIQ